MILDEFFKSKSTAVLAEGHGNYAGDRPVNLGGVSMKKIQIGDTVIYIDQKAQVVDMSQDREHARITIPSSSTTKTVLTSDLRSLGRGMAEDNLHGGGPDDEVKFFIDSEPAYYAVMDRFGDHIDFRGDDMVAPLRLWGAIQQTAGDAGGAADIAGLEDEPMWVGDELDEQGVAESGYDSGDYSNDRQSDDYGRDLVPTGSGGSRFVNHGAHDHTRGRPAKTHGFSKNLPADPFGRTAGKIPHSARPKQELDPFRELDELSPATLASYKTKAGAAATAADSTGDRKTGDRRFSGIVKATKKQFDQDAKQSAQAVHESRLSIMASIIKGQ